MSNENNKGTVGAVVDAMAQVKDLIDGDGFKWEVFKEPFNSYQYDCEEIGCEFIKVDEEHLLAYDWNWPRESWRASELYVRIVAEVDGCDVKNARVRPGSKSWIAWYNPRTFTVVTNSVVVSNVYSESTKCEACCDNATCVEFDISWSSKSWIGTDASGTSVIRICGDGAVSVK